VTLDAGPGRQAVEEGVARPFKLGLHEAADAILKVANANMSDAVRLISNQPRLRIRATSRSSPSACRRAARGRRRARTFDPRRDRAAQSGVTASALGCLLVDMQHDFSQSCMSAPRRPITAAIEAQFATLEQEALDRATHEGVALKDIVLQRRST